MYSILSNYEFLITNSEFEVISASLGYRLVIES